MLAGAPEVCDRNTAVIGLKGCGGRARQPSAIEGAVERGELSSASRDDRSVIDFAGAKMNRARNPSHHEKDPARIEAGRSSRSHCTPAT